MSEGLCSGCGHVTSQCQCGSVYGNAPHLSINITEMWVKWWRNARAENDARYERRIQDGREAGKS